MSNQPRQLGECLFTDGTTRPVFEDPDGRQYVGGDGKRVYGTWLPPADEPLVLGAELSCGPEVTAGGCPPTQGAAPGADSPDRVTPTAGRCPVG
jgi:hypothetical protein